MFGVVNCYLDCLFGGIYIDYDVGFDFVGFLIVVVENVNFVGMVG